MDCEILISEVCVRPALWNMSEKRYYNRVISDRLWEEVAEKMKYKKEECKKKWKYLKDQYRRALKTEPKTPSGSAASNPSTAVKFKYGELMSFIKHQLMPSETEGNISERVLLADNSTEDSDAAILELGTQILTPSDQNVDSENQTGIQLSGNDTGKKTSKVRKRPNNTTDNDTSEMIRLEDKKVRLLEMDFLREKNEDKDDDLLFFKSLLPFMKQFTQVQKLQVRNEIQSVILKHTEQSTTPVPSHSTWTSFEDSNSPADTILNFAN